MSFYDRAQRASSAKAEPATSESALIPALRKQLQEIVPVDELAKLASENPERARNEVRGACRRLFEGPQWAYTSAEVRETLVGQLLDVLFGFGVLEDMLADESITEIMANGPHNVFFEREGKISPSDRKFADEAELRALVDRILGPLGRRIDEASPMVNARLPQGHRVNVVVPPIAIDGPYLTIRKFSEHVITLEEMQESGSIDGPLRTFLIWAVRARTSIAVCGGTGSGKTTLLNALSCSIPHEERIVTIEDSAELRFQTHPDVARLEARPRNAEGTGEVTIRDLVINSLRMRPDRIIVGECRGAEALDMLTAMNTGHDGSLTTLHANSPEESISRLTTMVRYVADLPVDVIEANIASAIDLVVQTQRAMDGRRRVTDVVSLEFDRDRGRCVSNPIYTRKADVEQGSWVRAPEWLERIERDGIADHEEVEEWKRACSLD